MSKVFGIVGNTLYIEPFYGGDNMHTATVSKQEKWQLKYSKVKEYETVKELEDDYWSYLDGIFKIEEE